MAKPSLAELCEQLRELASDDLASQMLLRKTVASLDTKDIDAAHGFLQQFARRQGMLASQRRGCEPGGVQAALGWMAMLRSEYQLAAGHFRLAARNTMSEPERCFRFLMARANAFYRAALAARKGDALRRAVAVLRALLRHVERVRMPAQWRSLHNELGNSYLLLGEWEPGTVALERAIAAFQVASDEQFLERSPEDWALAQAKIGVALTCLGRRAGDVERLSEAVVHFRTALANYPREQLPLGWARTQKHLGVALLHLGAQQTGTAELIEAVEALRAALEAPTRDESPLDRAKTQQSLGEALFLLGEREHRAVRLEEAACVFLAASEELTKQNLPLEWAETRAGYADVLVSLGIREGGTTRLTEAAAVYQEALGILEPLRSRQDLRTLRTKLAQAKCILRHRRKLLGGTPFLKADQINASVKANGRPAAAETQIRRSNAASVRRLRRVLRRARRRY